MSKPLRQIIENAFLPRGNEADLPKFKNKPGTKGHFDELLAHHEYHDQKHINAILAHNKSWSHSDPEPDNPIVKHHKRVLTALEDHAEKHYYSVWAKGKEPNLANRYNFRTLLRNLSLGKSKEDGNSLKDYAEKTADKIRKQLPDV